MIKRCCWLVCAFYDLMLRFIVDICIRIHYLVLVRFFVLFLKVSCSQGLHLFDQKYSKNLQSLFKITLFYFNIF